MNEEQKKRKKKRFAGVVKSDRMDKTVTVSVERLAKDPRYGKYVRRKKTFMAHNPHNEARAGDVVEIESVRPLSRHKRWRVARIVRRAAGSAEVVADNREPES